MQAQFNFAGEEKTIVSDEEAYEIIEMLANLRQTELEGVTIYAGEHSKVGTIFVIIPSIGKSVVLNPFASHTRTL